MPPFLRGLLDRIRGRRQTAPVLVFTITDQDGAQLCGFTHREGLALARQNNGKWLWQLPGGYWLKLEEGRGYVE